MKLIKIKFILFYLFNFLFIYLIFGDWGLGIGDWGLGIGVLAQSPKPKTPNPKPQR